MTARRGLALAALLVSAHPIASCGSSSRTQLVVVVQSDLEVPAALDGFRARVLSSDGSVVSDRPFSLGASAGQVQLPADFGIVPRGGDASRTVTVEVTALLDDQPLFTTSAITGFVEGQTLRLDVFLAGRCIELAPTCDPDETCRREGCVDPTVDPANLEVFDPNRSAPDAGPPVDSGRPDPLTLVDGGQWVLTLGSAGEERVRGIELDAEGNVYLAGVTQGRLDLGGGVRFDAGGRDRGFVASYDPGGAFRWGTDFPATELSVAVDLALRDDGVLFVSGYFNGMLSVGTDSFDSGGSQDAFLASFDRTGNLRSVRTDGGDRNVQPHQIAVIGDAHAVTGVAAGTWQLGDGPPSMASGGDDAWVALLDKEGASLRWARTFGSAGNDFGRGVGLDGGFTYFTGHFVGSADFGEGDVLAPSTEEDIVVARYGDDGTLVWAETFGSSGPDRAQEVAVRSDGSAVVIGTVTGDTTIGGTATPASGAADAFVSVWGRDGDLAWVRRFGSGGGDFATATTTSADSVYVAGSVAGEASLDGVTFGGDGGADAYLVVFSPSGNLRRVATWESPATERLTAVAARGSIVVAAGVFDGTLSVGSDSVTSQGATDLFVVRLGD